MKKLILSTILIVLSAIGFSQTCQVPTATKTLTIASNGSISPSSNGTFTWAKGNGGNSTTITISVIPANTVLKIDNNSNTTYTITTPYNNLNNGNNGYAQEIPTIIIDGKVNWSSSLFLSSNQKLYILPGATTTLADLNLRTGQVYVSGALTLTGNGDNGEYSDVDDAVTGNNLYKNTNDFAGISPFYVTTGGTVKIDNGGDNSPDHGGTNNGGYSNYTNTTANTNKNYYDDDNGRTDVVYFYNGCAAPLPIHFTSFKAYASPNKKDLIVEFTYEIADGTTEKYVEIRYTVNGVEKTKQILSSTLNPSGVNKYTITHAELIK